VTPPTSAALDGGTVELRRHLDSAELRCPVINMPAAPAHEASRDVTHHRPARRAPRLLRVDIASEDVRADLEEAGLGVVALGMRLFMATDVR
jgi:hypothetical protein